MRKLAALTVVTMLLLGWLSTPFAQGARQRCKQPTYVGPDEPDRLGEVFQSRRRLRLVIGASTNAFDPARNLAYVERTAKHVDLALERAGYSESLGLLVGADVTRDRVLESLKAMESLDPSALVVIYYVGHGLPSTAGDDLYLSVADRPIGDDSGIAVRTLLASALKSFDPRFRKIPRVVLIIESCFSGGAAVFQSGFKSVFEDRPTDFTRLAFVSSAQSTEESRPLPGDDVAAFGKYFADALDEDWACADKTPDGAMTILEIATYVHEKLASLRKPLGGQMQPDFIDRGHYSTLAYRADRVATREGYRQAIEGLYEIDITVAAAAGSVVSADLSIGGDRVAGCAPGCRVLTDSPELAVLNVLTRTKVDEPVIEQQCTSNPVLGRVCVDVPRMRTLTVESVATVSASASLGVSRGQIVTPVQGGLVQMTVR